MRFSTHIWNKHNEAITLKSLYNCGISFSPEGRAEQPGRATYRNQLPRWDTKLPTGSGRGNGGVDFSSEWGPAHSYTEAVGVFCWCLFKIQVEGMDQVTREGRVILGVLELNNKSVNSQQKMKALKVDDPLSL